MLGGMRSDRSFGLQLAACLTSLVVFGCEKPLECTAEVTEGAGTYRASARGSEADVKLRRQALAGACAKLCRAKALAGEPATNEAACAARCAVDVEVGKIGGRVRCGR